VPGGFLPGREPDGNTYVLRGNKGLTVIDTGRHAAHREKIEALADSLHAPVVAIINTHWHLDHVSGNPELRAKYPGVKVYASAAINDALTGFLADSAAQARRALQEQKLDAVTQEEMRIDLATFDNGAALKPDVVVESSRDVVLGGLRLELHLAKDAATAGDLWVYDPATRMAFVGDLVTFPAPFLDTACSSGWSAALTDVSKTTFERAAPGHGPVLSRAEFATYRGAFDALIACSASKTSAGSCADAWIGAVAPLGKLTAEEKAQGREMTVYYVADVLRPNGGNSRYCAKKS
jgi:glyoxylase-like metal-dependent hydrolase (beta-lactamase superfamily II)